MDLARPPFEDLLNQLNEVPKPTDIEEEILGFFPEMVDYVKGLEGDCQKIGLGFEGLAEIAKEQTLEIESLNRVIETARDLFNALTWYKWKQKSVIPDLVLNLRSAFLLHNDFKTKQRQRKEASDGKIGDRK